MTFLATHVPPDAGKFADYGFSFNNPTKHFKGWPGGFFERFWSEFGAISRFSWFATTQRVRFL